ncbi:bifunctional L-myo-inositol-1-phosphate cytidylyltransferase/CDP-L-myo-inositol myo-inositolphosphotransferase [Thermococcus sibiricus]|uniref:Bifunctional IPC transferase and DIPP synthase n=1 Tax=Thermococcus sibiricus (strain DSM 12597 / MM 739) TaxID=604354 RepID=C6A371_THESM|nr:bifunctional L-myo-inositol-1-phosphate cytidylyltransferase/CDP-L-myo-inositol myo-inositolphosphotransferase [Thermococcus sibiricus]ACS90066.1 CDP-alcohol phosphatidyltransferase [Thermococcus sibiricus MM 739]
MKAVILAAGLGTRMGKLSSKLPKGLMKVAGREILYRTMKTLEKQGIEEFVIVTNPLYKEKFEEFLRKNNFRYQLVINNFPEKGNGYSLYLARLHVSEKFVLVMSDHIYEEVFMKEALKGKGLVVDKEGSFTNREEATKVKIENRRVTDIGKTLEEYDALDTGFFVLEAEIFDIIEKLLQEKESLELSEIVKEAQLEVSEVSGLFWMDIDTPEDIKKAKKFLIKNAVKGSGDGIVSRYLNRRISTKISELLVDYVEPIHMTMLSFVVGIVAAVAAFFSPPLGGVLYQLNSILDGVDGEIARAAMKTSKFGGYFDSILDRYVDFFVLLALALHLNPDIWGWAIVSLALFGSTMVSYSTERYKGEYFVNIYKTIPRMKYLFGKRDERTFITMILCLIGKIEWIFLTLAVVTNVRVFITLHLVRKSRNS